MNARSQWEMFALLLDQASAKYEKGSDAWAALQSVSVTAQAIAELNKVTDAKED